MRQLFGTDGIRGRAHQFPLDGATMLALGEALSHRLRAGRNAAPRILLGMDTRESGPEIAGSLIAGIRRGGGEARYVGIVPTPAVAYLCRISDAAAGISISASHNPYEDNGVKIFGHDGMKLADALELEIEQELMQLRGEEQPNDSPVLQESAEMIRQYQDFLAGGVAGSVLDGRRVVLDAGYGAAFRIAPAVFKRVGAEVIMLHDRPNGKNINEGSGALHPESLGARVQREKADFGVAFDGDADRAIFVDNQGQIRNGDEILYLWGTRAKAEGRLRGDTIVATVMSNYGFERQLAREGIRLLRAQVGDKYVLEMMQQHGATLGGEQSGHIIDLEVHTTGDGIHTALIMGALLARENRPFAEIPTFQPLPQTLVNEKVRAKPPLESLPRYQAALAASEQRLGGKGRILVRYSGTENVVRVMVEGEEAAEIETIAAQLRQVLRQEIGA
jgi:phosphoglucosamine mutase